MPELDIEADIGRLARLYAEATEHNQQMMLRILEDAKASPRSIFLYLNELVEKGAIQNEAFENALTEFYWRYC